MSLESLLESLKLNYALRTSQEGPLRLDPGVFDIFNNAPLDIAPDFVGPPGRKLKGGRGKDHPRYGRFIYALARHYQPDWIVEVGTYAGGTSVGWVKALAQNKKGKLLCVDNDTYSQHTYPDITRRNLLQMGVSPERFELLSGDSKDIIPKLAATHRGDVDMYLVDGDHTYEGALRDIENGLPMLKPGGWLLVHDVDRGRRMDEMTEAHPAPVYEAFMDVVKRQGPSWCILKYIRKHLGIIRVG